MDKQDIQLLDTVQIGLEAKDFLENSKIGQRIKQMADQDEHAALVALADVDATNSAQVQKLQNDAKAPAMALQWLMEIIADGENAVTMIEERSVQ